MRKIEIIKALRESRNRLPAMLFEFVENCPYGLEKGWIEDYNWSHYDMIHAVMPTEHLTRKEVQEELYECYRSFYGKWKRRYQGLLSKNEITRRTYQYLARKAILTGLQSLIGV